MNTILFVIAASFLIEYSYANYFTDQTPQCKTVTPRVRSAWHDLTKEQKKQYAYAVYYMKKETAVWSSAIGKSTGLYDVFVYIHKSTTTAGYWHSTPFFLPAHKWFLWVYESCIQYIAWKYWKEIGLVTQGDACKVTVPYWDWLMDYDANGLDLDCPVITKNWSQIWDADCFGDQYVEPGTYYVDDGVPFLDAWITVEYTGSNKIYPTNPAYAPYDQYLKRRVECQSTRNNPNAFSLSIGPSQASNEIVTRSSYQTFAQWLEGGGHGVPHMFCGFSMTQMFSPDDPLFFLHHCNVDRLYCLWKDCQGYEKVKSSALTDSQYYNWKGSGFSKTDQIPYWWDSAETQVLPKTGGRWPTPAELWSHGEDGAGYDGMNYRYGKDTVVRGYGKSCPDKTFTLVDVGYVPTKKRDDSLHPRMGPIVDEFEAKLDSGKTHLEALHEMAMTECENAPKNEIGPQLQEWIKMRNLKPEQFDSICDKPSLRMNQIQGEEEHHDAADLTASVVPLWLIIVASVGSALILIVVITIVIIFVMKRKQSKEQNEGSYRQM
jgi:hypothetical protein